MNALLTLWLPILLSAVVVFVISSLIHMVFKWHASDYRGFSNEDTVRDAIRAGTITPGHYVMPHCKEMKDMRNEAMVKKYQEGPVGHVLIAPNGVPNMGKYLGTWFLWTLVVAAVAGYMASRLIAFNHHHALTAAKLVGAITFIAHGFGTVTESIWMMRPWSSSLKNLLDAALYAIGSALVFFYLWP
jgi:hypothetical protein